MNNALDSDAASLIHKLENPMPIKAAEEVEAQLKGRWTSRLERGLTPEEEYEFIEFFAAVGFIPKFKSYGVKYAAPFGYSLFALEQGKGFSVQVHEESKVEAFHILEPAQGSFMLLGSRSDWEAEEASFVKSWSERKPTENPMATPITQGDIAVVASVNVVHTVIGGVLEEYATTSYDAVTRLHDQNAGHATNLPPEVVGAAEVLDAIDDLEPKRVIHDENYHWTSTQLERPRQIVHLPEEGLSGFHMMVDREKPQSLKVDDSEICTLVSLRGDVMINIDGKQQLLPTGATTALPPGVTIDLANASVYDQARVAVCKVAKSIALSDLRSLGDA